MGFRAFVPGKGSERILEDDSFLELAHELLEDHGGQIPEGTKIQKVETQEFEYDEKGKLRPKK